MRREAVEEAVAAFERLGFTQYEAKVFVGLTSLGSSSVSELYSAAEVPRSAVYGVLKSLVEKGVVEVSRGKPSKYHALPPEKVLRALESQFDSTKKAAMKSLKAVQATSRDDKATPEMVWFVKGHEQIEAKVDELIKHARGVIFVGMKGRHLDLFIDRLKAASRRGVKVLYLAAADTAKEYEAVSRFAEPVEIPRQNGFTKEPNMGFIYVDGHTALVISFSEEGDVAMESAFYTQSESFLSFIQMALASILGPHNGKG